MNRVSSYTDYKGNTINYGYDENGNIVEIKGVDAGDLTYIQIADTSIEATLNHPFWVDGYGFMAAGELEAGDVVETADGELLIVAKVQSVHLDEPVIVYNFEVEDWHTYYVSEAGIFVHNYCGVSSGSEIKAVNLLGEISNTTIQNLDLNYKLGANDIDLRGTGKNYRDALEMAFEKTGYSKEQFIVSKWAKDINGKSIPVEYIGPNSAMVNIDIPHYGLDRHGNWATGPDAPHVGWEVGRKNSTVGHIILDDVPTGRDYAYSDLKKKIQQMLKGKE